MGYIGGSDTILSRGGGDDGPTVGVPAGTVIGGYAVESPAGVGGMGIVYRAHDTELGRTVALKLIAPERAGDPHLRELFVRESLTAAALEHPNVLPIYRAGDDEGQLFIAMRFVEGASLQDLIAGAPEGIPPGRAARVVARVGDALDAAHARGLVHRDVKPANILIADPDGDEHVYLSDFGLTVHGSGPMRADGSWAGTLAYLAPEQIRGEALDARTDVYALGCVLFHALTGRTPFPTGDEQAALQAHLEARPPVPSEVVAGLPPAFDEVVRRALAKRPEDRFATAGELGRAALAARYDVALLAAPDDRAAAEGLAAGMRESELLALVAVAGDAGTPEGIRASGACAVLVGRGGLDDWARDGLAAAHGLASRDRAFRLVLVLLPGSPDPGDPRLAYLAGHPWVDLRSGTADSHAVADLVRAVRGADILPGLPAADGVPPYRGLEAFREEDANLYFGREQDVARILERLRTTRFLAVLGPSGSGKSSVVQAGLLPARRREAGGDPRVLEILPGARPLAALAVQLAHLPGAGSASPADLAADERALDLAVARALEGRPPDEQVLIVVNQLEEIFTLCSDEGERAAFLGNLVYAATIPGGRTVVVATMRADFYHRLAEHPDLRALVATNQILLGPLDARGLRRAIEEPARRCGLELEPGLTRRILTDVADRPGTLPLLEHLLLEVWRRRRDHTLTLEGYAASGGVEGALARRANEVYGAMPAERQAIARRVLLRLTQPGEGTEDTRRRAERRELVIDPAEKPEVDAVVDALAEARLVTTGTDETTGEPVVEVTHEALIRGWPELRGWIDEDRDRLRAERRLSDAAGEWDRGGRDEGGLYRGARLAAWGERDTTELTPLEREFLDESSARAERDRQARRKRVKVAIGALSVAVAVIAGIAIFAFVQRNDAADQRDVATSRQLAGSSTLARARDPELATLLAESAYAASPTVEAEESLRQGVHQSSIRATLRTPDKLAIAATPAPQGRLAVGSTSGSLQLWDPEGDPHGASPHAVGTWPKGISAGPVRTTEGFVTGDETGALVLWPDAAAPGGPERIASLPARVEYLHPLSHGDGVIAATTAGAWVMGRADRRPRRVVEGSFYDAVEGPDPGTYITVGTDFTVRRWTGSSQSGQIPVPSGARTIAVTPDGTLLAIATGDGIDVRRLSDDSLVFSAPVNSGVNGIAWSADGARVAAAAGNSSVPVYTKDGRLLSRNIGHQGLVATVGFITPDTVASVGTDGSVRVWDAVAGVEQQLPGHTPAPSGGVTFDDRGRITLVDSDGAAGTWIPGRAGVAPLLPAVPAAPPGYTSAAAAADLIAVGLQDGRVIVRDLAGDQIASASFPGELPAGVALDPRGGRVAIALSDSTVRVLALTPGAKPQIVGRHDSGQLYTVAFNPVDGTIASGGQDNAVRLWGGPGGDRTLGNHDGPVDSVAFSPDGRWLATGSDDKTVRVWDLSGQDEPRIIRSHQAGVLSVAFAGNDRVVSGGLDAVRVTDWRDGVTLLTVPRGAWTVATSGTAPAIAWFDTADNIVREIECDVCGPIDDVQSAAEERTTRDLTEAEQADFHVPN